MNNSSNEWFKKPSKTLLIAICVTWILSVALVIYGASGDSNASLTTLFILFLAPSLAVVLKIFRNYNKHKTKI